MNQRIKRMIERQRAKFEQECQDREMPRGAMSGIIQYRDIPYLEDGDQKHRLDVFRSSNEPGYLPIVINIHGGGLVMGNKEYNRHFCAKLAKLGFLVFAIEYRLCPEVTVLDQLEDVARAMDYVQSVAQEYGGLSDHVILIGDSAGAFLAYYTAAIQNSKAIRDAFGVTPSSLSIRELSLICGMFYTTAMDRIGLLLAPMLYGPEYRSKPYYKYLDPGNREVCRAVPPCFFLSSTGDPLLKYTMRLKKALRRNGRPSVLAIYANKKLPHAFCVVDPDQEDSIDAIESMALYLQYQECEEGGTNQ